MKGLFPQYDQHKSADYAAIWKNAIFVFDTNVLLNLYRYQTSTCEELLSVLAQLSERIWIPHHVALEFQRNRLKVIAGQGKRFSEIRNVIDISKTTLSKEIEKLRLHKRHALINPDPLINGFEALTESFLSELDTLQQAQQTLTSPDPLKERIETLFNEKVGPAYTSQQDVDNLNKEAENRYKLKIPPGYKDEGKDKDGPDEFIHNGIIYKRKYGDYIVWSQLLKKAETYTPRKLIFITDDSKEDWWSQIDFEGMKTTGPRPELIDEAIRIGKLESFLMYKPEGFLQYAKEFLQVKISENTLNEVREVSSENKAFLARRLRILEGKKDASVIIHDWLANRHSALEIIDEGFFDVVGVDNEYRTAYDVRFTTSPNLQRVLSSINQSIKMREITNFTTISILYIADSAKDAETLLNIIKSIEIDISTHKINIIISFYEPPSEKLQIFLEAPLKDLVTNISSESEPSATPTL